MIKISAVSYLNTLPFIYGLKQSKLIDTIDLHLDYPAVCADKLINDEVDLALVPVVVIPILKDVHQTRCRHFRLGSSLRAEQSRLMTTR